MSVDISRFGDAQLRQSVSKICLQEPAFLSDSRPGSLRSSGDVSTGKAEGTSRGYRRGRHGTSSSQHSMAAEIKPLDYNTTNIILAAFADHVENKYAHRHEKKEHAHGGIQQECAYSHLKNEYTYRDDHVEEYAHKGHHVDRKYTNRDDHLEKEYAHQDDHVDRKYAHRVDHVWKESSNRRIQKKYAHIDDYVEKEYDHMEAEREYPNRDGCVDNEYGNRYVKKEYAHREDHVKTYAHKNTKQARVSRSTFGILEQKKRQFSDLVDKDIQNKRIAIISDDHKIAITSKVAEEIKQEMAAGKYQEIDENGNQGFPVAYRLCPNKIKNQSPGLNKKCKDKVQKSSDAVPVGKAGGIHQELAPGVDVDSNNHYLAIVPASDIDVAHDKRDMVYGPFYFVKKTEAEKTSSLRDSSETQRSDTSNSHLKHHRQAALAETHEQTINTPLDINKCRSMSHHEAETLIKQSVRSSPQKANVQWAFSPKKRQKVSKRGKGKTARTPPESGHKSVVPVVDQLKPEDLPQLPPAASQLPDVHNCDVSMTSDGGQPADASPMKYMKANVEFLIGVGVNEVKVKGARHVR